MTRLYPIRGRAQKCGPSALSSISGRTTDDCATIIRTYVRKNGRPVFAVYPHEMVAAARALGFRLRPTYDAERLISVSGTAAAADTVRQWSRKTDFGMWILFVGGQRSGHFVAVDVRRWGQGRRIIVADSCNRLPVPLAKADRYAFSARSRVRIAWRVVLKEAA